MHQVFEPGIYEHTCAGCGHKTKFTVPLITNSVSFGGSEYDDENPDYIKSSQEEY